MAKCDIIRVAAIFAEKLGNVLQSIVCFRQGQAFHPPRHQNDQKHVIQLEAFLLMFSQGGSDTKPGSAQHILVAFLPFFPS